MSDMQDEEECNICSSCSEPMSEFEEIVSTEGELLCGDCAYTCDNCDYTSDADDSWYSVDSDRWCDNCTMNEANYCEGCNEYTREYLRYASDTGQSYCMSCDDHLEYCEECDEWFENECRSHMGSANIHNYSYRPDPIFHSTSDNERLFFGFELEMEFFNSENRRDAADYAAENIGGMAYLKEDGSLDTGFELVTHPMSFDFLMNHATEVWDVLTHMNQRYNARSFNTSTCGFHIHISRSGFNGGSHMHRFLNLVYSNEYFFSKLAGRKSERWAKFDDVIERPANWVRDEHGRRTGEIEYGKPSKKLMAKLDPLCPTDRYSAVNTQNQNTLELRIFKGTLSQPALAAHIQLAHAAVEYTRTLSVLDIRNGALTPNEFINYIEAHGNIYADLMQRIEQKQLINKETAV